MTTTFERQYELICQDRTFLVDISATRYSEGDFETPPSQSTECQVNEIIEVLEDGKEINIKQSDPCYHELCDLAEQEAKDDDGDE